MSKGSTCCVLLVAVLMSIPGIAWAAKNNSLIITKVTADLDLGLVFIEGRNFTPNCTVGGGESAPEVPPIGLSVL